MKTIKLGKISPSYPAPPTSLVGSDEPEEYFPGLHLELPEDAKLPDEGVLTVKYRINREVNDKKEDKCCVDLDVLEIVDVEGTKPKEEYGGDVLDKLRDEAEAD